MRVNTTGVIAGATMIMLALCSGTAAANPAPYHGDPSAPDTSIASGFDYTARVVERSVVLTTAAGALTVQGDQFRVLDDAGNPVAGIPLTYLRDGMDWPIMAHIEGRTATLTPSTDPADARPSATEPMLKDIDAAADAKFDMAMLNALTQLSFGVTMGTLIGTAIGAGIGCIAGGAVVGAAAGVPTVGVLAIPGFLGGCLATAAVTGPIGGMIGTIVVGVPTAIAVGIQFYNTMNKPA